MPLGPRYLDALQYALELHKEQVRKGTRIPYVAHLMSVSALALEYGATEDEAIAALLHDAVEDQGGEATRVEIEKRFGPAVAEIVSGCTDADVIPKPPWRARKEAYVAAIPHKSRSIRLVSCCDKLHNARAILADYREHGPALFERFTGGRDGTIWYYKSLAAAFREARPRVGPVDELARTVRDLEKIVLP